MLKTVWLMHTKNDGERPQYIHEIYHCKALGWLATTRKKEAGKKKISMFCYGYYMYMPIKDWNWYADCDDIFNFVFPICPYHSHCIIIYFWWDSTKCLQIENWHGHKPKLLIVPQRMLVIPSLKWRNHIYCRRRINFLIVIYMLLIMITG